MEKSYSGCGAKKKAILQLLTHFYNYSSNLYSYSTDCGYPVLSIPEPPTKPKDLLYITDILGRTTYPIPNQILFYIYDDGSVEKKIRLER